MLMHNPPHPGEVVRRQCLEPLGMTVTEAAKGLGVSRNTLSMLFNGRLGISSEMAIRLSQGFGGSPESWLKQQMQYDLWQAKKRKVKIKAQNFEVAKKIVEIRESIRRELEPFSAAVRSIEQNSDIRRFAQDLKRHQELVHAAFGPFEEIRRASHLKVASAFGGEFQRMRDVMLATEKRFRLPEIAEATKLFRAFKNNNVTTAVERYQKQLSEFQRAMKAMRTPWIDMENSFRSIGGFAQLQGIGHALRTVPAFDTRLTAALRIDLGDWRNKLRWPDEIFTDPLARTSFYAKRGLDPALTAFPANAFKQSIVLSGLKGTSVPVAPAYNFEWKVEKDEEEAAFERTNTAHDQLQRFETQIRKFIDVQMKRVFGENWIKHQVPGEILKIWLDKRTKARDKGESEWPLIAYADFSDYVRIITRDDNWQKVFKLVFGQKVSVQESFQRIYPIRICTMHSRLITQDDELYLYVETKRLLAAIGIVI